MFGFTDAGALRRCGPVRVRGMRILAFDSATSACSAAVWRDGEIAARRFEAMKRGQSEALIPMVIEVMNEAGWGFDSLDLLAVTIGPGAFTGVRIGLAAARGMAIASGLPVVGVTTLEAVAHGLDAPARAGCSLVVAIDAKRTDFYVQSFAPDLAPLGPPRALMPEAVAGFLPPGPVLIAGDGAPQLRAALIARTDGAPAGAGEGARRSAAGAPQRIRFSPAPGAPDAADVAAIAGTRAREAAVGAMPRPLYLHPPDARLPENGQGGDHEP